MLESKTRQNITYILNVNGSDISFRLKSACIKIGKQAIRTGATVRMIERVQLIQTFPVFAEIMKEDFDRSSLLNAL